ncbi:hypothetical protein BGW36DRAFT_431493 [Talaromyces proteolyticus]|uniref:Uncharacterized protein n=1 Tax=Talaromyces proteolyticus TaxID=1131652 RepID=A0AAD4KKF7_9EURO|nr:uncharacterized protein BGW36DRAFT_431493 [Talaromyces proteolyticus]KAH8692273.1 hypothetical protein BGW36DRAFT_431493 [Talaromyces proteolyticus]
MATNDPAMLLEAAKAIIKRPSANLRKLRSLPMHRLLELRKMDKKVPDLNGRAFYSEAVMAQAVGVEVTTVCKRCKGGAGHFQQCVIVSGFFNGACANCHFGHRDVQCSLYSGNAGKRTLDKVPAMKTQTVHQQAFPNPEDFLNYYLRSEASVPQSTSIDKIIHPAPHGYETQSPETIPDSVSSMVPVFGGSEFSSQPPIDGINKQLIYGNKVENFDFQNSFDDFFNSLNPDVEVENTSSTEDNPPSVENIGRLMETSSATTFTPLTTTPQMSAGVENLGNLQVWDNTREDSWDALFIF